MQKSKIRWDKVSGYMYTYIGKTVYECEHGKNRDKVKNDKRSSLREVILVLNFVKLVVFFYSVYRKKLYNLKLFYLNYRT